MSTPEQALQTQLTNIQKKTGKSLLELHSFITQSGLTKHGEIRDKLKQEFGLGHGDANTLVHAILKSDGTSAAEGKSQSQVLDEIYVGSKAGMRSIHEALMNRILEFGEFEIAPKKGYVSLRRKKQFAMLGPKTNTRFEVGINAKVLPNNERLIEQPKGSMCNYVVRMTNVTDADPVLFSWLKTAYDQAG